MAITYHAGRRIQLLKEDRNQGYDGGLGVAGSPTWDGGGGGGASEAGFDQGNNVGGAGGDGRANPISGSTSGVLSGGIYYLAGGGGGGILNAGTVGAGGKGGGGAGANTATATAGTTNTGSGGGGSSNQNIAGAGGEGIVIIKFLTSGNGFSQVNGTESTSGSYKIITYTSTNSSSFTPTSSFDVQYLVVAGGGAGGHGGNGEGGGGGGAGGFRTSTGFGVTAQAYTITVGGAGTDSGSNSVNGGDGSLSSIVPVTSGTSIISTGGGGGASGQNNAKANDGGSGGGGNGLLGTKGLASGVDLTPSDVQVGSRLEETDTRKMYHYEPQVADYDYPMTTDPRTNTFNSSLCTITHANSTLQMNQITNGGAGGSATYIDLLSALSTKWVMRFKTKQTAYTSYAGNSQFQVGMSSVAPTSTAYNISSSLNWIGFRWYFGTQFSATYQGIEPRIGQNTGDNTHNNSTARLYGNPNNTTNTGTSYYHEFIWNVDTFTYNLYDNANYTGTKLATAIMSSSTNTQWVTGTPSSISGLRYFVFKEGGDSSMGVWVNQLDDVEIWDGVIVAATGNAWKEEGT